MKRVVQPNVPDNQENVNTNNWERPSSLKPGLKMRIPRSKITTVLESKPGLLKTKNYITQKSRNHYSKTRITDEDKNYNTSYESLSKQRSTTGIGKLPSYIR